MASPPPPDLDALISGINHLHAGKYFQLAAFVMLIYDHILTFPQELDRIWRQKITGASFLFLLNRYVTPLQFIIILDAFHDPRWTKTACDKFVVFEGASTAALIGVCELIMILRVYALYGRSWKILTFLMVLWAGQIAVSAAGLHTGFAVPLPPFLVGCILTGSSPLFPSLWVAPLILDSCIFVLTLWRTRRYIRESGKSPTLHIFMRDGALYFFIIFLANLMNTVIFFASPADLKAIGASFSQLITATMVSRLVLNLRSASSPTSHPSAHGSSYNRRHARENSFVTHTIVGNLGADFDTFDSDISRIERYDGNTGRFSMRPMRAEIPIAI
ncbi:hypothetical protein B0H34DRAFT_210510 [Crassisporium funariophilum]|nr:hypothetical protein B0H34DRAFT_210510 [Crassisporium funariophilum]